MPLGSNTVKGSVAVFNLRYTSLKRYLIFFFFFCSVLLSLFQTSAALVNIWLTIDLLLRTLQKAPSSNASTNTRLAKSHLNSSL